MIVPGSPKAGGGESGYTAAAGGATCKVALPSLSYYRLTTMRGIMAELTTTVSTKGQVILPKVLRERLQWDAGTRLVVEHTADGVLLRPMTAVFVPTRPEDVFSSLRYDGMPKSVADMDAGLAEEVKRRHAGGRY